ncbi:putative F-box protein [Diachasmimorpha longicaudata entomopoxvirus]|uniref:Putative F-box protein n=1 Tax=Diachasmimorpha longicaudata entomopoxvirus TaxID=109981 RepID=A0A7R5WGC5_9POXV|nr:putative F-box protein [Diachasmimorpha longicaudata entomopoxvirus]AKS26470.1 putative F-box protein [Diachasmimorpha longicaudata entomopoxvirus]
MAMCSPTLTNLPTEVLVNILSRLDKDSLLNIQDTHERFEDINLFIWRKKAEKELNVLLKDDVFPWNMFYKLYLQHNLFYNKYFYILPYYSSNLLALRDRGASIELSTNTSFNKIFFGIPIIQKIDPYILDELRPDIYISYKRYKTYEIQRTSLVDLKVHLQDQEKRTFKTQTWPASEPHYSFVFKDYPPGLRYIEMEYSSEDYLKNKRHHLKIQLRIPDSFLKTRRIFKKNKVLKNE